jgi:hypothetical protein
MYFGDDEILVDRDLKVVGIGGAVRDNSTSFGGLVGAVA